MDGVLDFLLLEKLRQFFAYRTLSVGQFNAFLQQHFAYFPDDFVLPAFLDNHDMNRFLWIVNNDKRRLRLAALFLFTMPGPPIVYYGTEVGLSQPADVVQENGHHYHGYTRMPMLWGKQQDRALFAYFQRLHHLRRRGGDVWWRSAIESLIVDDARDVYVYRREPYTVALNNGPHPAAVPVRNATTIALRTEDGVASLKGRISLPPFSGAVLC